MRVIANHVHYIMKINQAIPIFLVYVVKDRPGYEASSTAVETVGKNTVVHLEFCTRGKEGTTLNVSQGGQRFGKGGVNAPPQMHPCIPINWCDKSKLARINVLCHTTASQYS